MVKNEVIAYFNILGKLLAFQKDSIIAEVRNSIDYYNKCLLIKTEIQKVLDAEDEYV
jgi:hypothetical protein